MRPSENKTSTVMDRKLSTKATRMRNRFSFSRSGSVKDRTPKKVSPGADSPSRSRSPSATNPESLNLNLMEHNDSLEPGKGYNFTDEDGYFRPESPLMGRQEIHEDLLANVKHACALLSHSIDRGIPAGLSYQSTVPNWAEKPRQSIVPNYTQTPRQSVVPNYTQTPRQSIVPNYTQTPRQSVVPNYPQTPRQSVPSWTQTHTQSHTPKSTITVPDWINTPHESTTPNWLGKPRTRLTGKRKPGTRRRVPVPSSDQQTTEPVPVPPIPLNYETENNNKHDSGFGMSDSPTKQARKSSGGCNSGTLSPARFYNKTSSTPPESRNRSRSPRPEESLQSLPREPSFCLSPEPFPYNPPQTNINCPPDDNPLGSPVSPLNETDKQHAANEPQRKIPKLQPQTNQTRNKPTEPSPAISPEKPSPTERAQNWDSNKENHKADPKSKQDKRNTRFYGGTNATAMAVDSREWLTRTFWEDRAQRSHDSLPGSSFGAPIGVSTGTPIGSRPTSRYGAVTPRWGSTSTEEEAQYLNYPYGTWATSRGMSYSSSCLADEFKHQENVYSCVVPSSSPPRNRRQKASMLFRKLAGLGRREERVV